MVYIPNNDLHGDIIPSATNTYSLGSSSYRYTRGYINNLYTDYMYPSANSCTIGDANNPYLCMYMTTTNAYSDYAVVNKAYLNSNYWGKNMIDRFILSNATSATSYTFTMPTTYATCLLISRYDVTALQYSDGVFNYQRLFGPNNNYKLSGGSFNATTRVLTLNWANTMWGGITIFNCGT